MRIFLLVYSAGALATYLFVLAGARDFVSKTPGVTPAITEVSKLVLAVFWPGFWVAFAVLFAKDDD